MNLSDWKSDLLKAIAPAVQAIGCAFEQTHGYSVYAGTWKSCIKQAANPSSLMPMNSLSQPFENILITTVANGPFFIDDLFQRKFAHPAPGHGNSVVCFYRRNWQEFMPVCYANFNPYDEIMLGGGATTDVFAFRKMPRHLISEIKNAGGIYLQLLRFTIDYFRDDCEAFFGYTADKLALEVDIKAGFEPTKYKHLVAHFHKPLDAERRNFLIDKANSVGPF